MSQYSNSSFVNSIAWIFSSLALIAYAWVAFMGLEYVVRGNHLLAFGITLSGAFILGLCVWGMCRCKISRDKRRAIPLGFLAFLGVVVVLVAGNRPVSLYLYVYDHEKELSTLIADTRNYAIKVDFLYHDYVMTRVEKYKSKLKEENKINSKEQIRLVNSLNRRILSPAEDNVQYERRKWLSSLSEKNAASNISTARNLRNVLYAADKWIEEYRLVSSVIYEGEDAVPFNCDGYTLTAKEEYDKFCLPKKPERRSLFAMFGCISIILLTYFFLWRPKSRFVNRR